MKKIKSDFSLITSFYSKLHLNLLYLFFCYFVCNLYAFCVIPLTDKSNLDVNFNLLPLFWLANQLALMKCLASFTFLLKVVRRDLQIITLYRQNKSYKITISVLAFFIPCMNLRYNVLMNLAMTHVVSKP